MPPVRGRGMPGTPAVLLLRDGHGLRRCRSPELTWKEGEDDGGSSATTYSLTSEFVCLEAQAQNVYGLFHF